MEKGVKGVRVSPRQCGKILSAGCLQLHLCQPLHPPNEPAKATLHQSNTMFFWPLQLPGAQVKVRDRHADYTACLQIIIRPCRSPPTPSSFILHSSSNMSTSLSKGPFDPHYIFFLVNNTGVAWKDEWWHSGRTEGWRDKRGCKKKKSMRKIWQVSWSEWAPNPDWMSRQKTDGWHEQGRSGGTNVHVKKGKEREEWIRRRNTAGCTDSSMERMLNSSHSSSDFPSSHLPTWVLHTHCG